MFPPVTTLAASISEVPSRIGDPDNFLSESDAYIAKYGTFRTESNALASYLNAAAVNFYNWGNLDDVNPAPVLVPAFSQLPSVTDNGPTFTSRADGQMASMYALVGHQNSVGTLLDTLTLFTGASAFIPDAHRPVLAEVAEPPSRAMTAAQIEVASVAFHTSLAQYADKLGQLSSYLHSQVTAQEDFGLLGSPVTQSEDYGVLP
jgi:hypothetical protein